MSKPVKWAIFRRSTDQLLPHTVAYTRRDAIEKFLSQKLLRDWPFWREYGFSARKITMSDKDHTGGEK